jgi:hypothetical protein
MNFDNSGLCDQTVAQNKCKLHAKVWMVSNRYGLSGEINFPEDARSGCGRAETSGADEICG